MSSHSLRATFPSAKYTTFELEMKFLLLSNPFIGQSLKINHTMQGKDASRVQELELELEASTQAVNDLQAEIEVLRFEI